MRVLLLLAVASTVFADHTAELEALYRRALELRNTSLKPDDSARVRASVNLANFLLNAGRPSEAEPLLREAIEAYTAQGDPLSAVGSIESLAQARLAQGDGSEAEALLRNAIALYESADPESDAPANSILELAQLLVLKGSLVEATKSYEKAFAIRPTLTVALALANVSETVGDVEAAAARYRQILEMAPATPTPQALSHTTGSEC